MASLERNDLVPLKLDSLERLAMDLDDESLGIALRLVLAQAKSPDNLGLLDNRIHEKLRIPHKRWASVRTKIAELFDLSGGRWTFPETARILENFDAFGVARSKAVTRAWKTRKAGRLAKPTPTDSTSSAPHEQNREPINYANPQTILQQPDISTEAQTVRKSPQKQARSKHPEQDTLPLFATTSPIIQKPPTLRKSAIDTGIALWSKASYDEKSARREIGQILKFWHDADVLHVFTNLLNGQGPISHPLSMVQHILAKNHRRKGDTVVTRSGRHRPAEVAKLRFGQPAPTEEVTGMSQGLMKAIRERNSATNRAALVPTIGPETTPKNTNQEAA